MMPLLARSHTVVAVDMRGMGDSSPESAGYDKKTLANDIYQLIVKLHFSQVDLVGHDWGGPWRTP
jgi:pimeloyl-ACP methyl ester carboxylesterase